jgi:hypothetical protein
VGAGYAATSAIAAALLGARYLMEQRNAADVAAASGMYAGGDLLLGIFILGLFMIPTAGLIWVMAKSEALYMAYSQLLVGISLTAPVSLSLVWLGERHVPQSLVSLGLCRLVLSPFMLVGTGVSRLVARFERAKKLVVYALLVEGLTAATAVAAVALLVRGLK